MNGVTQFLGTYWTQWLEWPLEQIKEGAGIDLTQGWPQLGYKVAVTALLLIAILEALTRAKRFLFGLFQKDDFDGAMVVEPLPVKENPFVDSMEAARDPRKTIEPLKKAKDYRRIAEIHASLNEYREAAKWFTKAKDRKSAAMQWALAGETTKAADLLMKEGDFATAARFYSETGKPLLAAKAFLAMGDLAGAGNAAAQGGKPDMAAEHYAEYFAQNPSVGAAGLNVAEACFAMLESEAGRAKVAAPVRAGLLPSIATHFEAAERFDLAARLYQESGTLERAGQCFLRAGKLDEASACLRSAGKAQEAGQVMGRYLESQGRFAEAAAAHAAAGDARRAGECYAKVGDAPHAAEWFVKAGEYYRGALAVSHLGRHDEAIRLLQRIKEDDRNFDASRALLGRCFYELRDYSHCVATLENHLTGRRVETSNIEYFYMLALAYEQLGKLNESKEILYKIQAVDVGYRDVSQRVSNIISRIQISASGQSDPTRPAADAQRQESRRMEVVSSAIGSRYRLERELGHGGMGIVYLARDTQLERDVAIKYLGTMMGSSEQFRQRFVREAEAAARVNHPNVTSIYDIGTVNGETFIVMEYVEGANLRVHVKNRGLLAPREAVNIAVQACGALDAIHRAGIVHRDVKPENFLITKGGLVKLTDFGLAKSDDMQLTAENVMMGTPAYMSPEQTRGIEADPRSDLYSLGLVLYEMLTGKVVFGTGNVLQRQQFEVPPPPSTLTEGLPPELDAVVIRCLAKNRDERHGSAAELAGALRAIKLGQ